MYIHTLPRTFELSRQRLKMFVLTFTLLIFTMTLPYTSTLAASITVNSLADTHDSLPGDGIFGNNDTISIRAALEECNAGTVIDSLVIPGPANYQLTRGSLILSASNLQLVGMGMPSVDGVMLSTGSSLLLVSGHSNSISGMTFRRSSGSALVIHGDGNSIGKTNASNFFFTNSLQRIDGAAIEVAFGASNNTITANWIGMAPSGDLFPNQIGIAIRGGSGTFLGGTDSVSANWIAGNLSYGILVTDNAAQTQILTNRIGLSASRISAAGNQSDGIRVEYSSETVIGTTSGLGLLVSGNLGNGITLTTGAENISLRGMRIGTDLDSDQPIGNHGNGISVDGAVHSVTCDGPKLISGGNHGHGIFVSGTLVTNLVLRRCHVGLSEDGFVPVSNILDGIHLENTRDVVIGDTANSNFAVVSGNNGNGIALVNGTSGTLIQNTVVGVTANGASSMPNMTGILISEGCHDNQIGRNIEDGNLISGNRGDIYPQGAGILLYGEGCESNSIAGNLIGTDGSGTRALRNGSSGIVILGGASLNTIGGIAQNQLNIISGNGTGDYTSGLGRGIHISGIGTTGNRILGNRIGTTRDGLSPLSNSGHGIGIFAGATQTEISSGNLIAYNRGSGVFIRSVVTSGHSFAGSNVIFNDSGLITLDQGANEGKASPVLASTIYASGMISGNVTSAIGDNIEFYLLRRGNTNPTTRMKLIGSMISSQPDPEPFSFAIAAQTNDSILAIATDSDGNSSEFSQPVALDAVLDVDDQSENQENPQISLQTYPNPSDGQTTIAFALPNAVPADIAIYNLLGQQVRQLGAIARTTEALQMIEWDGTNDNGVRVAAGIYFVRVRTNDVVLTRTIQMVRTGN